MKLIYYKYEEKKETRVASSGSTSLHLLNDVITMIKRVERISSITQQDSAYLSLALTSKPLDTSFAVVNNLVLLSQSLEIR